MHEPTEYKPTFFDRHGPDAGHMIRAWGYGLMVFGLVSSVVTSQLGFSFVGVIAGITAGVVAGGIGAWLGEAAGSTYKRFMVDGISTPYVEQYSYQQALVMQGRIEDALESFEAVIAERPDAFDARTKAAELYSRDVKNHARAAELFRQAQRIPAIGTGQFVYVTNRLVDLYAGPLDEPGKALVELRKLIDRYPGSPAAENARDALATLKKRVVAAD